MTTKTTHYFYRTALTLRSPFHNYTNSAVSFNMYSQQFTLCYCLVKSHFSSYSLFKFVYVTSGAPPLRKILEPSLVRVSIVGIRNLRKKLNRILVPSFSAQYFPVNYQSNYPSHRRGSLESYHCSKP